MCGRVGWVTVCVLLCGPVLAQEAEPASAPARNPALARQLLAGAKVSLGSRKWADAAAALQKALQYDPSLLEGHYLSGKAQQGLGKTGEAIGHYKTFLKLTESQAALSGEQAKWAADAKGQLGRLCVFLRQWWELREAYAKQFRALAWGEGGMPSCVRALEIAVSLVPEKAGAKLELKMARSLVADVVPTPAKKADPETAAILVRQAADLRKAGKSAEAV